MYSILFIPVRIRTVFSFSRVSDGLRFVYTGKIKVHRLRKREETKIKRKRKLATAIRQVIRANDKRTNKSRRGGLHRCTRWRSTETLVTSLAIAESLAGCDCRKTEREGHREGEGDREKMVTFSLVFMPDAYSHLSLAHWYFSWFSLVSPPRIRRGKYVGRVRGTINDFARAWSVRSWCYMPR